MALDMPSSALPLPTLTLILASTPSMGIGRHGTLPWAGKLKKEMAYFARVTKRPPPPSSNATSTTARNAVIMGRKTWDSIPPRFRPMRDRTNVVVSRSAAVGGSQKAGGEGALWAGSLEEAVRLLLQTPPPSRQRQQEEVESERGQGAATQTYAPPLGKVFVIGGAEIYAAALRMPATRRILWTRIRTEFECDTVFPLDLEHAEGGWERKGQEELFEFIGERLESTVVEETGVEYEFLMYERQK